MPEQSGEKSYDASQYKRQKAREQGQVARSQDLASAIVLIAALLAMMYFGAGMMHYFGGLMQRQLGQPQIQTDADTVAAAGYTLAWDLARVCLPLMGAVAIAAVFAHVGQVGLLFTPQRVGLDFSRLNPLSGLGRIFSMSNLVRLGFGVFKIAIVVCVAVTSLWYDWPRVLALGELEIQPLAIEFADIAIWTCLKIGAALLILAILDFAYQKWKYEQDLKMTHQEVREELKTTQGDPQVAAQRRAVQRQIALQRLSSAVPQADFVVTNPTELAVAIRYDHDSMHAPKVVAKGAGSVAARIRRIALENDVPVVERKELARYLFKNVEVDQFVPQEHYAAVAEILRYVYDLKGQPLPGMGEPRQ